MDSDPIPQQSEKKAQPIIKEAKAIEALLTPEWSQLSEEDKVKQFLNAVTQSGVVKFVEVPDTPEQSEDGRETPFKKVISGYASTDPEITQYIGEEKILAIEVTPPEVFPQFTASVTGDFSADMYSQSLANIAEYIAKPTIADNIENHATRRTVERFLREIYGELVRERSGGDVDEEQTKVAFDKVMKNNKLATNAIQPVIESLDMVHRFGIDVGLQGKKPSEYFQEELIGTHSETQSAFIHTILTYQKLEGNGKKEFTEKLSQQLTRIFEYCTSQEEAPISV